MLKCPFNAEGLLLDEFLGAAAGKE